jgi:hypothetical protein
MFKHNIKSVAVRLIAPGRVGDLARSVNIELELSKIKRNVKENRTDKI